MELSNDTADITQQRNQKTICQSQASSRGKLHSKAAITVCIAVAADECMVVQRY